jgi:hypothetical protein
MRVAAAQVWGLAVGVTLTGCFTIGNDKDGPKKVTSVADALTKSVSFSGGMLIEGSLPDASTDAVFLLPDPNDVIDPGSQSLMSFAVDPPDADATAALVQFEGSTSYFLIEDSAFMEADAGVGDSDGGVAAKSAALGDAEGKRRITLSYKVSSDVCAQLCDTLYEVTVLQALTVGSDDITRHASAVLHLDCRERGDRALCTGSDGVDAAVLTRDAAVDASSQPEDAGMDAGMTDTPVARDAAMGETLDAATTESDAAMAVGDAAVDTSDAALPMQDAGTGGNDASAAASDGG